MNLTSKRQLPNVHNDKIRHINSSLINAENDIRQAQQNFKSLKQTRFLVDSLRNNERISTGQKNTDGYSHEDRNGHSKGIYDHMKTITKQQLDVNGKMISSKQDSIIEKVVQSRLDRRLLETEREIKRNRGEYHPRKLPIHHEEDKTFSFSTESNHQTYESQLEGNPTRKILLSQQNSATLRECAKTIRESVMQFKDELMRNEVKDEKQIQKDGDLLSLLTRRRKTEQDHHQSEHEHLIHQPTMSSKSITSNEIVHFKKELDKNERHREQLSDQLESLMRTCNQKDKLMSKTLLDLKEVTETCDTFERQNTKLQQDLTLALERLEEMTEQAEGFAQESLNSQKQLADSEQKREEFQIQTQETNKQWKARVHKLEKDIERTKLDSTQISEKNEQLIKELDNSKLQNLTLREHIIKLETDLNESNINCNQLEEQFKQNEQDLTSQISIQRQRLIQNDKEKQDLQLRLQEEISHRNTSELKLKQYEQDMETINTSRSQLQQQIIELEHERKNLLQKIKEFQFEKESLLEERTKLLVFEKDYHEIKKKLEITKNDHSRGMKTLQMEYENKIETFQLQLSDEKTRNTILQRYETEHKKEIERLQEKSTKYEEETIQGQHNIQTLSREIHDKCRLISEFESKTTKLTVELTNQRNQINKKDNDYQNSLQTIYNDIVYCTKCLSNDSNQPFTIESAIISRDDMDVWFSKLKAHLAWFKQELEIHETEKTKLRQDLNNTLLDCEADRTYFASELAKREILINKFTNDYQNTFDTTNEFRRFDLQIEYDNHRILTENQRDHIDDRYRQFQIMIDSVKRELQTAKVQLSA